MDMLDLIYSFISLQTEVVYTIMINIAKNIFMWLLYGPIFPFFSSPSHTLYIQGIQFYSLTAQMPIWHIFKIYAQNTDQIEGILLPLIKE